MIPAIQRWHAGEGMERSERFVKIQRLLKRRGGVSLSELMDDLQVKRATVFRDLAYLRDRMGVPYVHDRDAGRYRIDPATPREELPGLWFSAREIHALLSMQALVDGLDPSGFLAEHIEPLRQRLLLLLESRADSAADITRRLRIIAAAAREYAPQHFQAIASALLERRRLRIRYTARSRGETEEREVSPQRLVHYRDNWYLDAWCHRREALRSFSLDAIEALEPSETPAVELTDAELDASLGAGYGIFAGAQVRWAILIFSPQRARWVAAELWHPQQEGSFLDDGRYRLRLPYSNDPELIMDILKYGPDCEVAEPEELRGKVARLLKEATGIYER